MFPPVLFPVRPARVVAMVLMSIVLAACGGGGDSAPQQSEGMSRVAQLGQKIFNDTSLSLNHNQACASCHVADVGHAGPRNSFNEVTERGSDGMLTSLGGRMAPSIRYLSFNKQAFHFEADGTPAGGFFWDGRADSLAAQAKGPFLNPKEMANPDVATVIRLLANTTYAEEFKTVFGQNIFSDPDAAFDRVALALQAYQQEDADFKPFSSKYDAFLRGKATLTTAELRGMAWFNSPSKGNCQACHPSGINTSDGSFPLFTDFSFDSLGVPRNWDVPGSYADKGLCESAASAIQALSDAQKAQYCGFFKVPSLRNAGLRKAFFHNGRFTNLTDVVTFYVQRDTNPDRWYRDASGGVDQKFNDLPDYRDNVNTAEVPYNRHPGDSPALTDDEISEVVSFLCTLTDGWTGAAQSCNR